MLRPACLPSVFLLLLLCPIVTAQAPASSGAEFFEKQIRPLLVERCHTCHGDKKPRGSLRLTSRASLLKGGDTSAAVVPGKPDQSLLIQAVRYTDALRMPPKDKLSEREIVLLTRWVQMGAPWPEASSVKPTPEGAKFKITDEQRRFWSFQPVKKVTPPTVRDRDWPLSPIDLFILAKLETKNLRPALPADKATLLRRVTFDLTGLPPTPDEVEAFLADRSSYAYEKAVDRLLASPAYGERWGRHWLDLARYADSFDARGIGSEGDIAHAWRYRDWVVNAFNRDLSYDRFLTNQIAGDLLSGPDGFNRDGVIATGFLAIGNWGGGDADKEKLLTDIADDQLDVVSRSILGLTVACARCHDHKFDPISTADYYGLAGIFFSTHILPNVGPKTGGPPMLQIPLLSPKEAARRKQHLDRLAALQRQQQTERQRHYQEFTRAQLPHTSKYLVAAWEYAQRPADQANLSLDNFARKQKLLPFALRQWAGYLGMGDYVLMTRPLQNVLGRKGVVGWNSGRDTPSLVVNTTRENVRGGSFTLPARAVTVHPSPTAAVGVSWRSPVSGTVKIEGNLSDADPVGGDGIAWALEHFRGGMRAQLASGGFENGGKQLLEQAKGAATLKAVEVKAGDRLELLVFPKGNHGFDTTVVEWTITRADGSKTWNLTRDLLNDPLENGKGNPHRDGYGNTDVWHFHDLAGSNRGVRPDARPPALAAWHAAVAGRKDRRAVEEAAQKFQKTFQTSDATSPFWPGDVADEILLSAESRTALKKIATELESLRKTTLPPVDLANGARDGGVPGSPHAGAHDVRIHIRGRYDRLGDPVPRRFPEILAGSKRTPIREGSGRLELARWLTTADHPLTARVLVNRVWQHHFGEGLVRTPSNFGKLGEPPTHPELLDWLAAEFVRSGWSLKHLHRLIVRSAAYRQSSEPRPEVLKSDPDNRLFGRMNRRRLEAEAVRDALLAVSGKLDRTPSGRAERDFDSPRRTVYLMTVRSDRSGFGPLFDSADPTAPVDRRTVSTVAPQALFLLNNPFVLAQAKALAGRIVSAAKDDKARIERVYVLLYGRPPTAEELRVGTHFLAHAGATERAWQEYCQVLLCANEFVFVD